MARTVEIKYDFEPFDCIPSDKAKRFRRNLLQHGSKADKYGYTFADTSGALAQRERTAYSVDGGSIVQETTGRVDVLELD